MTLKKYKGFGVLSLLMVVMLLLTVVSCKKDEVKLQYIGGIIERAPDQDGSKIYLSDNERWLRWEKGDQIYVWSSSTEKGIYNLIDDSHQELEGTFESDNTGVTANTALYAFYPSSLYVSGNASGFNLKLPRCHVYRDYYESTNPNFTIDPDYSFGRGAMPMVAHRRASVDSALFFHSVAGIMRFQLFGGSGLTTEFTIDSIQFEEQTKRLSGSFSISGDVIRDNQPFLTSVSDPSTDGGKFVSITGANNTSITKTIGGSTNNLFTFYLPLPAVGYPYGIGTHDTTYNLKMHVFGKQGSVRKYYVRTLQVTIKRLSITMMPALEINTLSDGSDGDGSDGDVRLVGCGTEDRPFQIYDINQLVYLRDCMNSVTHHINGLDFTSTTPYIKICRSDISLDNSNWTTGFVDFNGYMYFSSSAGEHGGIKNESDHPLFESINATGSAVGVYVKGDKTFSSGSGNFSPLCGTNNGTMTDCHNLCNVTSETGHNLAGLCVTNNGTITGGANAANLNSPTGNVAGICYTNAGTLQGNFSLSSAVPVGANIAGICYSNGASAQVRNCQVSADILPRIESTGHWGVVVFENSGTVDNCRAVGTIVFSTTGSAGGIVNTNNGGSVNNCSLNIDLYGGNGSVGGIVAVMNGGDVLNCYVNAADHNINGKPYGSESPQATYAGGIVGKLHGGTVKNCFSRCSVIGAVKSGTVLGSIDNSATIENCWSDQEHHFLGDLEASRADYGAIGLSCFSAYSPDTNINCVLILKHWYRIMVPFSMRNVSALSAYYVSTYYVPTPNPPELKPTTRPGNDKYLCDALNSWVKTNGLGTYRSWTDTKTSSAYYDTYPILESAKSATKRYRRFAPKRR